MEIDDFQVMKGMHRSQYIYWLLVTPLSVVAIAFVYYRS